MAEATLAQLCKTCNNNAPKYTCPRCSSRTCSLQCYKRHQARAQCSGKRDPTIYKKRGDLATASSIDHDFNFLTSIERAVDAAKKITEEPHAGPRGRKDEKHKVLENFLAEQRIELCKAPKGIGRQKANSTHWMSRGQCVMWTIEWYLADGRRVLRNGRDTSSVCLLFRQNFAVDIARGQKRKRGSMAETQTNRTTRQIDNGESQDALLPTSKNRTQIGEQDETAIVKDSDVSNRHSPKMTPHGNVESDAVNAATESNKTFSESQSCLSDLPSLTYFYFVKPQTKGRERVLVRIDAEKTLRENLRGMTVFEFPTIQVLNHCDSELPEGFVLEDRHPEMSYNSSQT